MDLKQLAKERQAIAAYGEWLGQLEATVAKARDVGAAYRDAGIPLPPSLVGFLASPETPVDSDEPRLFTSAPVPPERPREAGAEWIWFPLSEANLTSIVLGVLHHFDGVAIPASEVYQHVVRLCPSANEGSMMNVGARLDGKIMARSPNGWVITDKSKAPVIHEGYVWGPVDVFQVQEVAAHRRILVLHVLRAAGSKGMGVVEVARHLLAADYCRVPVSKDLVKMDFAALEGDKKVRQLSSSRNWVATKEAA